MKVMTIQAFYIEPPSHLKREMLIKYCNESEQCTRKRMGVGSEYFFHIGNGQRFRLVNSMRPKDHKLVNLSCQPQTFSTEYQEKELEAQKPYTNDHL